ARAAGRHARRCGLAAHEPGHRLHLARHRGARDRAARRARPRRAGAGVGRCVERCRRHRGAGQLRGGDAHRGARMKRDLPMDKLKKPKSRRMRLSSVANAIRLTKAFSEQDSEMGISLLATRLGLAKSTVHRLATTLVEYDILEQNRESGKYRLGLALFELGTLVRRKMDAAS